MRALRPREILLEEFLKRRMFHNPVSMKSGGAQYVPLNYPLSFHEAMGAQVNLKVNHAAQLGKDSFRPGS